MIGPHQTLPNSDRVLVIDETIREGMQFRGLMFSTEQRTRMLEFQEDLGIDICQAGYPPAHESEVKSVKALSRTALNRNYRISVAGMSRAMEKDIQTLIKTGIKDFHLHAHLKPAATAIEQTAFFSAVDEAVRLIRQAVSNAHISIAVLDIGAASDAMVEAVMDVLGRKLDIDMISLPDTSGMMAPGQLFDKLSRLMMRLPDIKRKVSVHCHNDMGMAAANTVMGVLAGAKAIEVSVLGIGERNGIADLYSTVMALEKQGIQTSVNTERPDLFRAYYTFVDDIIRAQTGERLLGYTTPFFGSGVSTHVAGTHAGEQFGIASQSSFELNSLCGRSLVRKYLHQHGIGFDESRLPLITRAVKSRSAQLNRKLLPAEVEQISRLTS